MSPICLKVHIPNSHDEFGLKGGKVYVHNQSHTLDPSTPRRNFIIKAIMQSEGPDILVVKNDGGPEHNYDLFPPLLFAITSAILQKV